MRLVTFGPLLLLALGVGSATDARAEQSGTPAADSTIVRVEIENNNFHAVRVYAVSGSRSRQVGTVGGLTTEVFKLPAWFANPHGDISFVIHQIGRRGRHVSSPVFVAPGDEIVLKVENHLALSNAIVRIVEP